MANYPKELEDLIQEYLTDGIITAKERQVLLNKAASLGLNVDEIDLYIDAQQQKADQQVNAAAQKMRGRTCPFCGGSVPQLTDKCPHCGQQISVEASEELKEILENLEEALIDLKSGENFARSKATAERYMRKAKLYYSNNPKIKILEEEVTSEIVAVEEKIQKEKNIETAKSVSKQGFKGFLVALPFLITLILCIIMVNSEYGWGLAILVGPFLIIGAVFATRAIYNALYD